jgi:hypothetical protein
VLEAASENCREPSSSRLRPLVSCPNSVSAIGSSFGKLSPLELFITIASDLPGNLRFGLAGKIRTAAR